AREARSPVAPAAAAVAAVATTEAAAPAAAAAEPTAARTRAALFGLVDPQPAAVEFEAVHRLDGLARVVLARHVDERETARATGFPVHHQLDAGDLPTILPEGSIQGFLGRAVGKVAHVETGAHRNALVISIGLSGDRCRTCRSPRSLHAFPHAAPPRGDHRLSSPALASGTMLAPRRADDSRNQQTGSC